MIARPLIATIGSNETSEVARGGPILIGRQARRRGRKAASEGLRAAIA
jgi:hypothetical protein